MFLAGDIGGTKTHLAIYDEDTLLSQKKFPSGEYAGLGDIAKEFLGNEKVDKACFGVAGPVKDGRCAATNLPWIIDEKELSSQLAIPHVALINDLEANAYGLRVLPEKDFIVVNEGTGKGNQALVSPGTGLGEAGLFFDGDDHIPFACEGGHSDFSPRNEEEIDLLRHLLKEYDHVSFERLLSGPGLYTIYRFLIETNRESDPNPITNDDKKGPMQVTERALDGCPICKRAIALFIAILAGETGNVALKFLSLGGIYIGGGIVPKIQTLFDKKLFMKEFSAKGRFQDLLLAMPVKIVLNQETALLGAMYYAKEKIGA